MKGKQFLCIKSENGKYILENIIRAESVEEAKEKFDGILVEVPEGDFVVLLHEYLIREIVDVFTEEELPLPETEVGWGDIITDLVENTLDSCY